MAHLPLAMRACCAPLAITLPQTVLRCGMLSVARGESVDAFSRVGRNIAIEHIVQHFGFRAQRRIAVATSAAAYNPDEVAPPYGDVGKLRRTRCVKGIRKELEFAFTGAANRNTGGSTRATTLQTPGGNFHAVYQGTDCHFRRTNFQDAFGP